MTTPVTTLQEIKGRLLYFLLTDEYGRGNAQCKFERLIQCAPIPQHAQGDAKQAIQEMKANPDVPLYSKGGGDRKVIQINPRQLETIRELCNDWHPNRTPGQSFDQTDLSSPEPPQTIAFSTPYNHKGTVWTILESADIDFAHKHGAETNTAPDDHIVFALKGLANDLAPVIDRIQEATSGCIITHDSPPQATG